MQENLFLSSGNRRQIEAIREALDVGEEIDPDTTDIHAVAECLIGFLQALPEPVIPFHLYQRCIDCSNSYILCRQVGGGGMWTFGGAATNPSVVSHPRRSPC